MLQSAFILGLSSEERESALGQVLLWDRMTVGSGLRRALLRHLPRLRRHLRGSSWPQGLQGNFQKTHEELQRQLQEALEGLRGHLQAAPEKDAAWINEFTKPLDPQAIKLSHLLDHYRVPITTVPDVGTLHVAGLKIEARVIEDVRKAQRHRDVAGSQTTEVRNIDDLVRHVLRRLFTNLDDWLSKASPEERERVAEQIAKGLDQLGPDVQEEVRRAAELDDLAMETLIRAGRLAALGTGLSAATCIGGFAVYATLSVTIANAVGLVDLTLPFSAYLMVTSLLAFITNPLVVLVAVVGGGARLVTLANRRMRAELVPLLVAFAAVKSADPEARGRSRALVEHLTDRYQEFLSGDHDRRAQLLRAFPAFRAPKENHRADWSLGRLRP
jgi:hypothetical protein